MTRRHFKKTGTDAEVGFFSGRSQIDIFYTQTGWKFRKLGAEALQRRAVAEAEGYRHTGCGITADGA